MINEYPEYDGFDWDKGNRNKNLKHNVQDWECEQVFFNEPLLILDDPKHSVAEDRSAALGKTDGGRLLIIIYTMRGTKVRVISSRDMNRKEKRYYEDASKE